MIINMRDVVIGIVIGVVIMIFLYNLEDIKRSFRERKRSKRYNRLFKGIPSRVVGVMDFDDVWINRYKPMYIGGRTYKLDWKWFHCNDEYVTITDRLGIEYTLSSQITSSVRLAKDRWNHSRGILMRNKNPHSGFKPVFVKPDTILEVY
ncbi:hypothetical protein COPG_00014 [Colwellia phage 9A]|uniref:Uncharacterized protein n=1 Tax=Colwellia phage 9A TaxID=765765 RepID=I3UM95_9CAUD|nr:hypothetical protein COPG_00014 [Colwellia phage 9A]AFK66610.1 hypothetical protein COPG_00014 [Colwellia phage 9A]